ncbi:MAG: radical SAM protein, partial [Thermoplasmata archaeon]
ILHSDDLMLYGGNGVIPNGDKLVELHQLAKKHFKTLAWSHASVAGLLKAEQDSKAISRISEIFLQDQDWIGVEIGVETGSPRLANIIMPAKASPFDTQKWPEIVKEAAGLMADAHIIPAMTLITGLPEETEDDVRKTIELVEDLWDFKALIMPMFFVPMGKLKEKDWFKANELSDIQIELLKVCMSHGLRQSKRILREYVRDTGALYPLYPVLRGFIGTLELLARKNKAIVRPDHPEAE